MCMSGSHMCACYTRGQGRILGSLKWKLWAVVSYFVGPRISARSSEEQPVLVADEPSLQPLFCSFLRNQTYRLVLKQTNKPLIYCCYTHLWLLYVVRSQGSQRLHYTIEDPGRSSVSVLQISIPSLHTLALGCFLIYYIVFIREGPLAQWFSTCRLRSLSNLNIRYLHCNSY